MKQKKCDLFEAVDKNQSGFYELKQEYRREMQSFYEDTYYQTDKASYKKIGYSDEEIQYKKNLFREKEYIYLSICCGGREKTLLDVGCGEGYAMQYFYENGWAVCGLDFSNYAIKAHNPAMENFLTKGDLMKNISTMKRIFGFIIMDNVLEHLPRPADFLSIIKDVCDKETVICITVPNDFSLTQKAAHEDGCIDTAFWVSKETSEHFNYFTMHSLSKFSEENGFDVVWKSADYPIDFNLFNPRTNYVRSKEVGHDAHVARLKIENMLYKKSLEDTVLLHSAFAKCGVGRNISVYLKLKK